MNSKVIPVIVIFIAVVLVLSVVILGQDSITGKAVGDVTYYCWGDSATDFQISTSTTKPYSWYRVGSWNPYCFTSANTCNSYCKSKGFASGLIVMSNTQQCVCSVASTPATCTDTDGGKNYAVKGTVTGDKSGGGPYTDVCEGGKLREVYCKPDGWADSEYYTCPSGQACSNGACIASTSASYYCWGASATDFQISTSTTKPYSWYSQRSWSSGYCFVPAKDCSSWCISKGYALSSYSADKLQCICSGPPITCADSDGGLAYNVKGAVVAGGATYLDTCASTQDLVENYCTSNLRASKSYICPSGRICSNGACIGSPDATYYCCTYSHLPLWHITTSPSCDGWNYDLIPWGDHCQYSIYSCDSWCKSEGFTVGTLDSDVACVCEKY